MLVSYALEAGADGSFLRLPEPACLGRSTASAGGHGPSDWWRQFGPWWRYGDWTVAGAPEMSSLRLFRADLFSESLPLAPGGFLPASRVNIATADDSNVEFRLRELIGAEQEAGHGHGSAWARRRLRDLTPAIGPRCEFPLRLR